MRSVACLYGRIDVGDCGLLVHGTSESSHLITPAGLAYEKPPIKLLWSSSCLRFASSMHVLVVVMWVPAEPVYRAVHAPLIAWP